MMPTEQFQMALNALETYSRIYHNLFHPTQQENLTKTSLHLSIIISDLTEYLYINAKGQI